MAAGRDFKAYDPKMNTWTELAPLPIERFDAAVVTGKDGKIYVMGGAREDPADTTVTLYPRRLTVYDPNTNTWQVKAAMPTAREGPGAVIEPDGTILAIGGVDRFGHPTATVQTCVQCSP